MKNNNKYNELHRKIIILNINIIMKSRIMSIIIKYVSFFLWNLKTLLFEWNSIERHLIWLLSILLNWNTFIWLFFILWTIFYFFLFILLFWIIILTFITLIILFHLSNSWNIFFQKRIWRIHSFNNIQWLAYFSFVLYLIYYWT